MNYRHLYHAGSFSDVLKHIVLMVLLKSLQKKDTPFCFLESHAGIGLYPLDSVEAQKQQEYQNGIAKLFSHTENTPNIIQQYLSIVSELNMDQLKYYPGSPWIAEKFLREHDQMILCELHPEDVQTLKNNFPRDKKIAIHHMDGYSGMKAFLPPKNNRGLVFMDPPFEKTDEFNTIIIALKKALKHFRSGQFMIWYPMKNNIAVEKFYRDIFALHFSHFIVEISLNQKNGDEKLSSCGIIIINPPWKIEEILQSLLPYLENTLDAHTVTRVI